MRIRLTSRATRDLDDIFLYSAREWGVEQAKRYKDDLDRALEKLAQFPHLGRPNQFFGPDARSLKVAQHIIAYRVRDDELIIARIVHVRRGPSIDLEG